MQFILELFVPKQHTAQLLNTKLKAEKPTKKQQSIGIFIQVLKTAYLTCETRSSQGLMNVDHFLTVWH